jgi:hypothetical protein
MINLHKIGKNELLIFKEVRLPVDPLYKSLLLRLFPETDRSQKKHKSLPPSLGSEEG